MQIVRDVTGIDIADILNARAQGEAIGDAINQPAPRRRAAKPPAEG